MRAARSSARRRPTRLGAVLGLVAAWACAAPAAAPAQSAVPVETAPVSARPVIERVRLPGTVMAPRRADVSSEIASRVLALDVALGQSVAVGDPLVTLDDTLERLALERAEAGRGADEARLSDAMRRVRDARTLVAENNLPENELKAREAEAAIAEARLAEARARIARLGERVERHVIRAPFAGVVTARRTEAGEWVEPGDPVVELVATDGLVVDLPVPQRYFARVGPETGVRLGFEALGDREVEAAVSARVPMSDPTARTFLLRVRPLAMGLEIAPGMSATATLALDTGRRAPTVPRDAVMRYPDGRTTVWLLRRGDAGATVEERPVRLGEPAGAGALHVREGLEAGVEVVTRGNEALSPGQSVRVVDGGS